MWMWDSLGKDITLKSECGVMNGKGVGASARQAHASRWARRGRKGGPERSLEYATRRAKLQREGENRVPPLGMTEARESGG